MSYDPDAFADPDDPADYAALILWSLSDTAERAVPPDGGTDEYVRGFRAGQRHAADQALSALSDKFVVLNWEAARPERTPRGSDD